MSKKNLDEITAAFGNVHKAAEKNRKAREDNCAQEVTQTKKQSLPIKEAFTENNSVDDDYQIERKSKRVNFLLYPSVYSKALKEAKKNRQSLNDYVNTVLANSATSV